MKGQSVLALSGLVVAALAAMVACNGRMINVRGTFDVRIETTPGPEATQAALEAENARLATRWPNWRRDPIWGGWPTSTAATCGSGNCPTANPGA